MRLAVTREPRRFRADSSHRRLWAPAGVKRTMNVVRVICLTAAFSLPQIANAAEPFTKHAFGMLEGTLAFCTQVNPQSASKYQDKAKGGGNDEETLPARLGGTDVRGDRRRARQGIRMG